MSISAAANSAAMPVLAVIKSVGLSSGGQRVDPDALKAEFAKRGYVQNSDGSFQIDKISVLVNDDSSMELTLNYPDGGTWKIDLADSDGDGEYKVTDNQVDRPNLTASQENVLEEAFTNIMENNDVYCHKKKKGGSSGSAGGGSDNWFIQMAESLGEMLNQMANDVKTATDNVRTKNGQAPFKDSMRVQGLAQQLSFMSQCFMTTLNSIGEAIKTSVTAGGAAR